MLILSALKQHSIGGTPSPLVDVKCCHAGIVVQISSVNSLWRTSACWPVQQFKPEISVLRLTWCETCRAECDLLLKDRPAQHSGFRCTLHRACLEWEQWLKMELIHSTAMQQSHTKECGLCVCFCAYVLALFLCFKTSNFSSLLEVVFSEIHTCKCVLSTCIDNQAYSRSHSKFPPNQSPARVLICKFIPCGGGGWGCSEPPRLSLSSVMHIK